MRVILDEDNSGIDSTCVVLLQAKEGLMRTKGDSKKELALSA